jgi:hypothetical protein
MTKKHPGSVLDVEEVSLGPVDWQFEPMDEGRTVSGSCSSVYYHTIKINNKNSFDANLSDHLDTVFHELLHAIDLTFFGSTKSLTEQQVWLIAQGLEELFLENPTFVKWIADYSAWQRENS